MAPPVRPALGSLILLGAILLMASSALASTPLSTGGLTSTPAPQVVHPLDTVGTISPSTGIPDVGDKIWINATMAVNGEGPTYSWTWLPPGCSSSNSLTIACTLTGGGGTTYHPTLWDADTISCGILCTAPDNTSASTTVTVAPKVAAILAQNDLGQVELGGHITYTVAPSGGTGIYRTSYVGLPTGCLSSNTTILVCTPTATGSFTVIATVKDSLRPPGNPEPSTNNATTTSLSTTVDSAPTLVTSAIPSATDPGLSIQFNGTTTGGLGANGFWWGFGDGGTASLRNPVHSFASYGTYLVSAFFNDSETSTPAWVTVTVNGALAANATATPAKVIVGTPVALQAVVSGGTSPTALAWRYGDGLETSSFSTPTHAYNASGTYQATVWANDSVGASSSSSVAVDVAPLLVNHIRASTATPDVGQTVQFNSTPSGGFPAYTWNWRFAGYSNQTLLRNPTYAFPVAGTFQVELWVNDTIGTSNFTTYAITVSSDPLVVEVAGTPQILDAGQSVNFTAVAQGGTSPTWLNWTLGDGTNGTGTPLTHIYAAAGTYVVRAWFNDSDGDSNESSTVITVNPDPTAAASVFPTAVDLGQAVQFIGTKTGGTPTFHYAWAFGDGGALATGQDPKFYYPSAGTFTATFWANDSAGISAMAQVQVQINSPVALAANLTPLLGVAPLQVNGSAVESGGTSPVGLQWTFGDGGRSVSPQPTYTFVHPGTYTVTVWANDSVGESNSTTFAVNVVSPLVAGPISASPNGSTPGTEVDISVTATGGEAPLAFSWTLNGTSLSSSTDSFSYLPHGAGNYSFAVTVRDALGEEVRALGILHVVANVTLGTPLSVSLTGSPTKVGTGGAFWLNATAAGGTGPYTYLYFVNGSTLGSPQALSTCEASSPSCRLSFSHGGTYTFYVEAEDSDGHEVSSSEVAVTVTLASSTRTTSTPSPTFFLSLTREELYILIIMVVVILLLGLGVALSRRRRTASSDASGSAGRGPSSGPRPADPMTAGPRPSAAGAAVAGTGLGAGSAAAEYDEDIDTPAPVSPSSAWDEEDIEPAPAVETATEKGSGASPSSVPAPSHSKVPLSKSWPSQPLTLVEAPGSEAFWKIATGVGLPAESMLILCDEKPEVLEMAYGLRKASFRWITRTDGEGHIAPGDVDRIGFVIEEHLEGGKGRVVLLTALDRIEAGAGGKNAARLLDAAREAARNHMGAVLVRLDPQRASSEDRQKFESGAHILRLHSPDSSSEN